MLMINVKFNYSLINIRNFIKILQMNLESFRLLLKNMCVNDNKLVNDMTQQYEFLVSTETENILRLTIENLFSDDETSLMSFIVFKSYLKKYIENLSLDSINHLTNKIFELFCVRNVEDTSTKNLWLQNISDCIYRFASILIPNTMSCDIIDRLFTLIDLANISLTKNITECLSRCFYSELVDKALYVDKVDHIINDLLSTQDLNAWYAGMTLLFSFSANQSSGKYLMKYAPVIISIISEIDLSALNMFMSELCTFIEQNPLFFSTVIEQLSETLIRLADNANLDDSIRSLSLVSIGFLVCDNKGYFESISRDLVSILVRIIASVDVNSDFINPDSTADSFAKSTLETLCNSLSDSYSLSEIILEVIDDLLDSKTGIIVYTGIVVMSHASVLLAEMQSVYIYIYVYEYLDKFILDSSPMIRYTAFIALSSLLTAFDFDPEYEGYNLSKLLASTLSVLTNENEIPAICLETETLHEIIVQCDSDNISDEVLDALVHLSINLLSIDNEKIQENSITNLKSLIEVVEGRLTCYCNQIISTLIQIIHSERLSIVMFSACYCLIKFYPIIESEFELTTEHILMFYNRWKDADLTHDLQAKLYEISSELCGLCGKSPSITQNFGTILDAVFYRFINAENPSVTTIQYNGSARIRYVSSEYLLCDVPSEKHILVYNRDDIEKYVNIIDFLVVLSRNSTQKDFLKTHFIEISHALIDKYLPLVLYNKLSISLCHLIFRLCSVFDRINEEHKELFCKMFNMLKKHLKSTSDTPNQFCVFAHYFIGIQIILKQNISQYDTELVHIIASIISSSVDQLTGIDFPSSGKTEDEIKKQLLSVMQILDVALSPVNEDFTNAAFEAISKFCNMNRAYSGYIACFHLIILSNCSAHDSLIPEVLMYTFSNYHNNMKEEKNLIVSSLLKLVQNGKCPPDALQVLYDMIDKMIDQQKKLCPFVYYNILLSAKIDGNFMKFVKYPPETDDSIYITLTLELLEEMRSKTPGEDINIFEGVAEPIRISLRC